VEALSKPLQELVRLAKAIPGLRKENISWNEQLQEALEVDESSPAAAADKFQRLTQLSNDFVQLCKHHG
jgi:hypothetical protein